MLSHSFFQGAAFTISLLALLSNLNISSCGETSRMSFSSEKVISAVCEVMVSLGRLAQDGSCCVIRDGHIRRLGAGTAIRKLNKESGESRANDHGRIIFTDNWHPESLSPVLCHPAIESTFPHPSTDQEMRE